VNGKALIDEQGMLLDTICKGLSESIAIVNQFTKLPPVW
jgi:hypothetical protein